MSPFAIPRPLPLVGAGTSSPIAPLIWLWPHEHADRKREREADEALHGHHGATHYIYGSHSMPSEVGRNLFKGKDGRRSRQNRVFKCRYVSSACRDSFLISVQVHFTRLTW